MKQYSEEQLTEVRTTLASAAADLHRQELLAKLCQYDRLAYASLTGDQLGPMLVTYRHQPIGEVHTPSSSALGEWYAQPYDEDGKLGPQAGPFGTARAAAASLIER